MRITMRGLAERLSAGLPPEALAAAAAAGAALLADGVRARLSVTPGGDHAAPWLQTGGLRASVGVAATERGAVVGAGDAAAAAQELGTVHVPPRPFLAPVAAAMGGEVTEAVGVEVTKAMGAGR